MGLIIGALKIIIVLGTLITMHELGHFLVAKACDVKVHKFSIGFGPKILKKQGKETEYTLRLIPFGGFVQLEGEEERSDDERAFNKKPIYQRIFIVAAGAVVNILFAIIVFFFIVFSSNSYLGKELVNVPENSPEYIAGLRKGDIICKVNDTDIYIGDEVGSIIEGSKNGDFIFDIKRNENYQKVNVNIPITDKGLLGIVYSLDCVVLDIVKGTPAATSGLQSGDVIIKINNISIDNWARITEIISKLPNEEVKLLISRNGELIELNVITMANPGRYSQLEFSQPKVNEKFIYAVNETESYFIETVKGMATLFVGKAENVEVMGPVGIADQIASTEALQEFFLLMSAISLSLGLFNLLPIPALDGGKILLLIIEKIRKKPLDEKTEITATLVGFSLLMLLAVVVTVSDIVELF